MFTKLFWNNTIRNAVQAFAQTAVAIIGAKALLNEIDWVIVFSSSGLASVIAILTAIAKPQQEPDR